MCFDKIWQCGLWHTLTQNNIGGNYSKPFSNNANKIEPLKKPPTQQKRICCMLGLIDSSSCIHHGGNTSFFFSSDIDISQGIHLSNTLYILFFVFEWSTLGRERATGIELIELTTHLIKQTNNNFIWTNKIKEILMKVALIYIRTSNNGLPIETSRWSRDTKFIDR